jgi:hypothetical protein
MTMMATGIYQSPTKSSKKVATFRETHVDANASVQSLFFIPSSIILQSSRLSSAPMTFIKIESGHSAQP